VHLSAGQRQLVAFARALRTAVAVDPAEAGVPSTKGTLTA
jgi:imidazoleglycerol phosphate dehydratase HisB